MKKNVRLTLRTVLLSSLLLVIMAAPAWAAIPAISIDGQTLVFTGPQPYVKDELVMAPIRVIAERLGASVAWDENTRSAILTKEGLTVSFPLNQASYSINGEARNLTAATEIIDGSMTFPLKAGAESLGATVSWDQVAGIISITSKQSAAPSGAAIQLGVEASGSNQRVKVGDTVVLILDENPTTGYSWVLNSPIDASLLEVSDEYVAPDTALIGAGGQHKWVMQALKAGQAEISMTYKQNWPGGKGDVTFTLTVDIAEADTPVARELGSADSGQNITINVGDRIVAALLSNSSTGYTWKMTLAPDETVLKNVYTEYVPGAAIPGAPGVDNWVFDALKAGSTSFTLEYQGPDPAAEPAETFNLNVEVK